MRIIITYDNNSEAALKSGWGFSCFIQSRQNILFDTGNSGEKLIYNLEKLQINPKTIDIIVLSHNHWDHTSGLKAIQNINSRANVINPKDFTSPEQISPSVFTTGALGMLPKEQSLVVKTRKGSLVITGCAHPGLGRIIKTARRLGYIYGILGGFHGFSDFKKLKDIELIAPCHCTLYVDKIHKKFPHNFRKICAGSVIEL
jgi:7,8-dihydropterin-6-yl-methyl-4-(beta-D-ribofuranosyl)aminobenzene 5'-phosphate synthase